MLAIITRANDDYWYEFKEIESIEDLFKIYYRVIVERNDLDERLVSYWEGFKKEDIPLLKEAKVHVTICNSWIE